MLALLAQIQPADVYARQTWGLAGVYASLLLLLFGFAWTNWRTGRKLDRLEKFIHENRAAIDKAKSDAGEA